MTQLVLLRHGQSLWNRDKVFTGWSDVPLTPKGVQEAKWAARLLKEAGYTFDMCFTSVLERSTESLRIVMSVMGLEVVPGHQHWRLNERHYGALEGLQRWEAVRKFGIWRVLGCQLRFNIPPPSLTPDDPRFPGNQPRYADIGKELLPLTESMQQARARIQPYWNETIVPELRHGKRVLIVAHKNSLRILMMLLENLSASQVMKLPLTTGRPLVYELDDKLSPVRHYYVDRQDERQRV